MSDITVTFKNETILTMDASGSKPLLTQGKYCEDDITIAYAKPSGGGGPATFIASGTTTQAYTLSYDFEQSIPELAAYINKTDGYTPGRVLMLFVTLNTSTATTRILRSILYKTSSASTVNVDTCGVVGYIYGYNYTSGVANITSRAANIGAGSTYEVYAVDMCSPFPNT